MNKYKVDFTKVKCFIDKKFGDRRMTTPKPYDTIGRYFEGDIQSDYSINQDFETIKKIRSGEIDHWEGTGNAYTVTITKDYVHFQCEYADEEAAISLEDYERLLHMWQDFIEKPKPQK